MKKALALTAFLTACAPAHAQQFGALNILHCGTRESVSTMLQNRFNEVSIFAGFPRGSDIHLDELWYDSDDGSYTFTRTNIERDITCIIMAGDSSAGLTINRPRGNQL